MHHRAMLAFCLTLVVIAVTGCGDDGVAQRPTLAEVTPNMEGADPRLTKITKQASQLLSGGTTAFDARLDELKGLPVVANKWASWCGPCIVEAPYFQQAAKQLGNRVAFLGVNLSDNDTDAEKFLHKSPLPYPSYSDPKMKISKQFPPPGSPPVTNIYDAEGRLVHSEVGQIHSAAQLEEMIDRYAGPLKSGPSG